MICPVLIAPLGSANVHLLVTGPQAAGKLELEETGPAMMPKPDPTGNERVYTQSFIHAALTPLPPAVLAGLCAVYCYYSCDAFAPSLPCQAT